jgi:WD40 repeat protein
MLGIGGGWGDVYLMDMASGRVREFERGHSRTITSIVFAQYDNLLVSSSLDHRVFVWDAKSGRKTNTLHETINAGCYDRIYASTYIVRSDTLVTFSCDCVVRFWQLASGKLIKKVPLNVLGHQISERIAHFAPEPLTLAIGTSEGFLSIYELERQPLGARP